MATFTTVVSGGGPALANALSSIAINHRNVYLVEDGIYDPLLFSDSVLSSGSLGWNTQIVISSFNGPENCIIDGGTVWENDVFGSNIITPGKSCISVDSTITPTAFNLSCYGFTIRNGYTNVAGAAKGAGVATLGHAGKALVNCLVERHYADLSSVATSTPAIRMQCHDCTIRDIIGTRSAVADGVEFRRCLIERISHLSSSYNSIAESSHFFRCIIRNLANDCNPVFRYLQRFHSNLIYNYNGGGNSGLNTCRNNIIGNTFVLSNNTAAVLNWNTNASMLVANNIFVGNWNIAARLSGPEVTVANNYARAFSGDAAHLISNVVGVDPVFVDRDNENFHLFRSSDCIAAGNTDFLSALVYQCDLDGKPWKEPPSIGCYQYQPKVEMPHRLNPLGIYIKPSRKYDAEIEYLENTGLELIDTQTGVDSNTTYDLSCTILQTAGKGIIYTYPQNETSELRVFYGRENATSGEEKTLYYDRGSARIYKGSYTNRELELHLGNYFLEDKGVRLATGTAQTYTTTSSYSLYVFNIGLNVGKYDLFRLKALKIYNGAETIRDFIPVRCGRTGYLYDRISEKLFGNSINNGSFILGPDVG